MTLLDPIVDTQGVFICDVSPPRGSEPDHPVDSIDSLSTVNADYYAVAYNPGLAVRTNSIVYASFIKKYLKRDVIAFISPRDMNRLALQSMLLGATILDVNNIVVVHGESIPARNHMRFSNVWDYSASGLITDINKMNQNVDFNNRSLTSDNKFIVGSTIDINDDLSINCSLLKKKIEVGTHFFITQPFLESCVADTVNKCLDTVLPGAVKPLIYYGIYILGKESKVFGQAPAHIAEQLKSGADGIDLAIEQISTLMRRGIHRFYIMPPVYSGGVRDYESASTVINFFKSK